MPSKAPTKTRPHPPAGGPRPQSRITVEGCGWVAAQNLSEMGFEIHLSKFGGFFYFVA